MERVTCWRTSSIWSSCVMVSMCMLGSIRDKDVDFVAVKNDRTVYVQATYLLIDEHTIEREYAPLELIADNYEKIVVSLDDLQLPSRNGIKHVRAWELSQML